MSYWIPTVDCKNPDCLFGKPTFLPYPNPLVVSPDHPDWPPDEWSTFLVCQHCGLGAEYTEHDVRWGADAKPGLPPHNYFVCVEMRCEKKDCEFPVKIYMFVGEDQSEKTVKKKAIDGGQKATCQEGYTYTTPPQIISYANVEIL